MKKSKPKNPAAVALGRKGGQATREKYTSKQLSEWGKQGGRGNRKPTKEWAALGAKLGKLGGRPKGSTNKPKKAGSK